MRMKQGYFGYIVLPISAHVPASAPVDLALFLIYPATHGMFTNIPAHSLLGPNMEDALNVCVNGR